MAAQAVAQQAPTRTHLTLKGSTALVHEFFNYSVQSILYQRSIYPSEDFRTVKKFGLQMLATTDDDLADYLDRAMGQLKKWLEQGKVRRLVVAIVEKESQETVERWQFDVEVLRPGTDEAPTYAWHADSSAGNDAQVPKSLQKTDAQVKAEIAAIIKQITASCTFLPVLEEPCTCQLLIQAPFRSLHTRTATLRCPSSGLTRTRGSSPRARRSRSSCAASRRMSTAWMLWSRTNAKTKTFKIVMLLLYTIPLHAAHGLVVFLAIRALGDARKGLTAPEHAPAWEPPRINLRPHCILAEELNEFLVHAARLGKTEAPVLVKDRRERPLLELAQASDEAACAVLSFVAVDEHGVVPPVQDGDERRGNRLARNCRSARQPTLNKWLLVARNAVLEEPDTILVEKLDILLGIVLENQREDTAQPQRLEERKVLLFGKAAPVHPRVDHRKVVRWNQLCVASSLEVIRRAAQGAVELVVGPGTLGARVVDAAA